MEQEYDINKGNTGEEELNSEVDEVFGSVESDSSLESASKLLSESNPSSNHEEAPASNTSSGKNKAQGKFIKIGAKSNIYILAEIINKKLDMQTSVISQLLGNGSSIKCIQFSKSNHSKNSTVRDIGFKHTRLFLEKSNLYNNEGDLPDNFCIFICYSKEELETVVSSIFEVPIVIYWCQCSMPTVEIKQNESIIAFIGITFLQLFDYRFARLEIHSKQIEKESKKLGKNIIENEEQLYYVKSSVETIKTNLNETDNSSNQYQELENNLNEKLERLEKKLNKKNKTIKSLRESEKEMYLKLEYLEKLITQQYKLSKFEDRKTKKKMEGLELQLEDLFRKFNSLNEINQENVSIGNREQLEDEQIGDSFMLI